MRECFLTAAFGSAAAQGHPARSELKILSYPLTLLSNPGTSSIRGLMTEPGGATCWRSSHYFLRLPMASLAWYVLDHIPNR